MKTKEDLRKSIMQEIEQQEKLLEMLDGLPTTLIAQAFPQGDWGCYSNSFTFSLPFDFALVDEVKTFMTNQYPEYELRYETRHVWDSSKEAGHFLTYRTIAPSSIGRFEFAFRTGKAGTTCVLNQIGEKTVPVYEVVCGEGAKESI